MLKDRYVPSQELGTVFFAAIEACKGSVTLIEFSDKTRAQHAKGKF